MSHLETGREHTGPVGEPTPTGKAFIRLVREYQRANPQISGVPLEIQTELWVKAAIETGDLMFARDCISDIEQTNPDKSAALSGLLEQAEITERRSIQ